MSYPVRFDVLLAVHYDDLNRNVAPLIVGAFDHGTLEVIDAKEEDRLWREAKARVLGPAADEHEFRTVVVKLDADKLRSLFELREVEGVVEEQR